MDWDLQAIVRGCSSCVEGEASIDSVMGYNPESYVLSPWSSSLQQDYLLFRIPDVSETTTILDELEQFYKPFYPQTLLTTAAAATSVSVPTQIPTHNTKPKKLRKQQRNTNKLSESAGMTADDTADLQYTAAVQPKKGKNQGKREVQRVTADGVACDKWAWRKYGQKPIKGSPYPRSYYRCSSAKGCLARKQVERSSTDPGLFIITYNAEHSHSHPTRRSSLAGSTRKKASAAIGTAPAKNQPLDDQTPNSATPSFVGGCEHQENIIKHEEERNTFEDGQENEPPATPDFMFPSLEDLEGILMDHDDLNVSVDHNFSNWFIEGSITLAGGGC